MQPPSTAGEFYATADLGLNIRLEASVGSEVVGSVPYGVKVVPTSKSNGWFGVTYEGVSGFVNGEFLSETPPPPLA